MTIVMSIFGILIMLISPILREFYTLHFKSLRQNDLILNLNTILLSIDKIFSHCVQIETYHNGFRCLLRDEASIFSLEKHKLSLMNSLLILDKNGTLYSPESDFNFALSNRQNLFDDKERKIYILKDGKIQIIALDKQNLNPTLGVGKFILLQSKMDLKLENNLLKYEIRPRFYNDEFMQSGIMGENITQFILKNRGGNFSLKLCVRYDGGEHCLQKILQ